MPKLWRRLLGEGLVGRTLVEHDVRVKSTRSGTVMCLQPAPCFSERKKPNNFKTIRETGGRRTSDEFQCEEADAQREGDPEHDLRQPA